MITTHVLDTAQGRPAAGVPVELDIRDGAGWKRLGAGHTDPDGRVRALLPAGAALQLGTYRLRFETRGPFFPEVSVIFEVRDAGAHYHVPLLLSPYGYSIYRGS
jgi:5-hydroxyisourate hydrolase